MRLDRRETIGGRSVKEIRDFLRFYRTCDSFGFGGFMYRLKATHREATKIAKAMIEHDLVQMSTKWSKRKDPYYELTDKGMTFSNARLINPIPRARADLMVKDMLARIPQINAREELVYRIIKIGLFGSYIHDTPDVGDVDVMFELARKPLPPRVKDYVDWNMARADASDRISVPWDEAVNFGYQEVLRLIKNRNPYISLHGQEDVASIKATTIIVYEWRSREDSNPHAEI